MSLKVGDLIPIGGGGYSLLSNVENFKVVSVGDQTIRFTWKDPDDVIVDGILITEWAGTQIRGKKGNYPSNEKDGVPFIDSKNRNQYQNTLLEITGLDNNEEYFFMAFPYTDKNVFTVDSANRVSAIPVKGEDSSGSPGSPSLIVGTMLHGYFGTVPASELFTGTQLSNEVGISQGTIQFDDTPWLKFALDGKILFRPMKAFRSSISYNAINSAECVFGTKTVQKNGLTYKVRLMKGANTDPADAFNGAICHYSEWNKLILPIHIKAKDKSWAYPNNVETDVPYWGIDFTNADLQITSGNGRAVWCQEVIESTSNRLFRGFLGVSDSSSTTPSSTNGVRGWAPVLEVVS